MKQMKFTYQKKMSKVKVAIRVIKNTNYETTECKNKPRITTNIHIQLKMYNPSIHIILIKKYINNYKVTTKK
jgi:hypothetical protein